jgi:ABC-type Na+ efflux pump permease subunit
MISDSAEIQPQSNNGDAPMLSNTVALIGLILVGLAAALCALMFALTNQLPDGITEFGDSGNDSRAHVRLLILGCSTAVLVVVAFVLCVVGMFLPNRPRALAIVGTALSVLILLGVFGVLIVGVIMNPDRPAAEAVEESPAVIPTAAER